MSDFVLGILLFVVAAIQATAALTTIGSRGVRSSSKVAVTLICAFEVVVVVLGALALV